MEKGHERPGDFGKKRKERRKGMDINIFENGWTQENAYIYGWVISDGCLLREGRNKTSYAVRITSNDKAMVEWLHESLCVGNKIYSQGKSFTIKYRNVDGISFMMKHGLTERKSLTVEFPEIPDLYVWSFIRGIFDGNGSVTLSKTKYNTYAQVSITSGSKIFLEKMSEKFKEFNIESHLYMDRRTTNKSWYLRLTKRSEIEKFYEMTYSGASVFLDRKHDKFNEYFSQKPKYKTKIA